MSWGHCICLPSFCTPLGCLLGAGGPTALSLSIAGAKADAASEPPYLRFISLHLGALVRLPKLVPRAGAIAAACPSCANPLTGVLVQGAPLPYPQSVAGAGADSATGPLYLCFSSLLRGALVRMPELVPEAGAIAAACPPCAHSLVGVLVQKRLLRHPKQLLELELMLLLDLLTFAPATGY